jgi:dipeptidase E
MTSPIENTRALLISTSKVYGGGYLDHVEAGLRDFLGTHARVLFVPYALADRDGYAETARRRFESMGYTLDSIHRTGDPVGALGGVDAIFVGGGNTFRLLKALYDYHLIEAIRRRVRDGLLYIGSSAGSNVACPTIKTTNDMPIVELPSLSALALVNFQINPHYLDADPNSRHMGETREERLVQYLEENDVPVVGLREGAMLRVEKGSVTLLGSVGARMFKRGAEPFEIQPGSRVDELLANAAAAR